MLTLRALTSPAGIFCCVHNLVTKYLKHPAPARLNIPKAALASQRRMICLSATTVHSASPLENAIIVCVPLEEYTKKLLKNVTPLDTDRLVGRYDAPSLSL